MNSEPLGQNALGEMLTAEEIASRFAPEWVLIGDPRTGAEQRLLGGRVLDHSPDRDEIDRKARELHLHEIAVRFLGTWPDDMALVL